MARGRSGWTANPVTIWRGFGLRARVTGVFALGALLLSLAVGATSYYAVHHFLTSDAYNASVRQAAANVVPVEDALLSGIQGPDLPAVLQRTSGSGSVLFYKHSVYSSPLSVSSDVPASLDALIKSGTPAATQNVEIAGSPYVVVGFAIRVGKPVAYLRARYFALFNLSDVNHTLHILGLALVLAALLATALGAILGRWASGRSLHPLAPVSEAAVAIAGGRLDTRLPSTTDPDLVGITTSFNRMVDQLQERIHREVRFTSDVSHELRSPLTTLSTSLEVLEAHRDELSPRARQALDLLAGDLRRFERMVADLLEISSSDAGSAEVALEEVEAGELVRRAVAASLRSLPDARAPSIEIAPALADVHLEVDKRRFERVMANLLENAAHYGGGARRVTAEPGPSRNGHQSVLIAVEDQGPGVPEAERERIFERFYRGQAAGRRGAGAGTGLGLALVAEHVRLLRGRVRVEEAPGGGARFVIELPIADARAGDDADSGGLEDGDLPEQGRSIAADRHGAAR